ncbi:MAG TPA: POTRA domain-containing protein [Candidatus Sulfotelmatobacter sp.]|nr:POTRA domain-containing protein [Candidatus Sulfotelmatobacter sp.]
MMKALSKILLLLLLAVVCLPGRGQAWSQNSQGQMPASSRQLIAIKVVGSKHFPEEAIAAATGLQMGTVVGDDDFKKAARRLGDTGAFTDIAYTFSYSSAGTKLEVHVTDVDKFVPARFEDFVWFTDAEIRRRIKEHVPLFDGQLPLSGRMPDEVSDVLQAMLVENAIPGHVDYLRVGKPDGPIESIDYKVSEVLIRVRNIEFTGAGEAELPALQAAAERLPERQYSRSRLDLLVQRQLLPVYFSRGYLKASFSEPQPKTVKDADSIEEGSRNQSVVDVAFAVTPGVQYKLKSIEWSGNHAFPTDRLQGMVHVEPGKPANTIRLGENLRDIQTLYSSRGFLKATIKVDAQMDDAAATVAFHLEVKEDVVYHMGDLEFRGLDNSLTAKLRGLWKIRQGEVYDATYLSEYLPEALKLLPPSLDWDVSQHVTANVREKTVDVDLIYSVKAPK